MNTLSASRFHCCFTIGIHDTFRAYWLGIVFANSFWINSFSQILYKFTSYEFTFCFAISLWIHYLFLEITMNSLFISKINLPLSLEFLFKFIIFLANSPWIHSIPQNHYGFTISFAISLWSHHLLHEFNLDSLFYSQNHHEYTIFFAKSISYHYLFREFILNPVSFSQNHYKFTICFTISE